jgi:hypothetical protein
MRKPVQTEHFTVVRELFLPKVVKSLLMVEALYCPRCAKPAGPDTSYCRSCGLALGGVAEIVKGNSEVVVATPPRRGFTTFGVGLGLFTLGLAIAILNAALRDLNLFPDKYGKMVFLVLIAAGLLTLSYSLIMQFRRLAPQKSMDNHERSATPLQTASPAEQLTAANTNEIVFPANIREPSMAEAPSVTENTTRHLE